MENCNVNCGNNDSPGGNGALQVCHGCKKAIEDEFRLHVSPDMEWHAACLTCCECQCALHDTPTCIIKDGRPYCRTDYVRVFGCVCALCSQHIEATELVMRAQSQVFHPECFRCSTCERKMHAGEQFGLSAGKLFCPSHFNGLPVDTPPIPLETSHNANATPNANRQVTSDPSPTNSSRKRSNLSEKGPRVRTVLSEQQLQTLRTVYASNPRPDALLKEHLVEMTGLSPRVIRVWFQNKRCKDKKKTIQAEAVARQQQQQGQGGQPLQQSKQIPPLTPQPPLTPDSMGQISPQSAAAMVAFQYPPSSYEGLGGMPSTPSKPSISPMASFQGMAWSSPPEPMTYEPGADFSSPMATAEHPHIIYSSAPSQASHFTF